MDETKKKNKTPSTITKSKNENVSVSPPSLELNVATKLNFNQVVVALRDNLKGEVIRFSSMSELFEEKESKMTFKDHIYVLEDILREMKLKDGDDGFNERPSANLSANHTITELCDKFNKQIRDGGKEDKYGDDKSIEDILEGDVEDAFESYWDRDLRRNKWRRKGGEAVDFSEVIGENIYMMRLTMGNDTDCVELAQAVAVMEGMTNKMLGLVEEVNNARWIISTKASTILKDTKRHPNFISTLKELIGEDVFRQSFDFFDEMDWNTEDIEKFKEKVEKFGCNGRGIDELLKKILESKSTSKNFPFFDVRNLGNIDDFTLPTMEDFAKMELVYERMRSLWKILDNNFKSHKVKRWEIIEESLCRTNEKNNVSEFSLKLEPANPFLVQVSVFCFLFV